MPLYDEIKATIQKTIDSYKEKAADGLTVSEGWGLLTEFIMEMVQLVADFAAPGNDKKAAVREAVLAFYDQIIQPIDIPWLPDGIVDPMIRSILVTFLDGMIEGAYRFLLKKGVIS